MLISCFGCKYCAQWIATAGVLLMMMQMGITTGWTSPNMARFASSSSSISMTLDEASWVASSLNLGRFVGAIVVPFLIELVGSKNTVLSIFIPVGLSWLILLIAKSVMYLYIARTISGISFGMAFGCFSLYLGEVSAPSMRGTLISLAMCGAPLGSVIGTLGETYLNMIVSSSIYLILCIVGIIIFIWLPESPYHLTKRNQRKSAEKSVIWYRGGGSDEEIQQELDEIKRFVETSAETSVKDKFGEFKSGPVRKAMILVIILFIFPQMCGLFNIMFYMEVILIKGKSFLFDPREFVILANVISVVATGIAIRLIDRLGRRILLMVSSFGTTAAMLGLGTHFYLIDANVEPDKIQWLPVASITVFMITFTLGFMTVPSTVLSEIFPSNVKSIAASVASLTAALFGFVSAKSYQPMIDAIGETYVFWIHAVFSSLGIPVALFLLPETKGKTFQQIQDDLVKR